MSPRMKWELHLAAICVVWRQPGQPKLKTTLKQSTSLTLTDMTVNIALLFSIQGMLTGSTYQQSTEIDRKIFVTSFLFVGFDRTMLDQYMEKVLRDGKTHYSCTYCGKENSHINNIRNHLESVHFPGQFTYDCQYCGKSFKSKNSLSVHVSLNHRDPK